ncbi:MAG: hypothetical protein EXR76_15330 [Myxococcales bacterium]|nr:hypothetical protein [Myxococcales bacterium]
MRSNHRVLFMSVGLAVATACSPKDDGGSPSAVLDLGTGGAGGAIAPDAASGGNIGGDAAVDLGLVAACADAIDNDGDGAIDADDPGCVAGDPTDNDEQDPLAAPECDDNTDNDGDGYNDFPDDPGCGSEFDNDEYNPAPDPQCNDGIDNDRDGLVDEQDPGCSSVADPQETNPAVDPQCANGLDDDGNGTTDFPNDPGCRTAGDDEEDRPPQIPACVNGLDDDGDNLTDYPDDPGCAGAGDTDETDKAVTPACADGQDNDRDGKIDFPGDDGCEAAADYNERGSCGELYDPPSLIAGRVLQTDTSGGLFRSEGSCGGRGSPEVVFLYRVEQDIESLEVSTVGPGTEVPTSIYVRRGACLDPGTEVGCQREGLMNEITGHTLSVPNPERGDYYIFIDGVAGAGGRVQVTVTERELAQCLNGIDDDGNGRVDFPSDAGCLEATDREETPPDVVPVCANDEDDDGDGSVDYPLDFGCIAASGNSELDRCGDGVRFQEFGADREFVLGDTGAGTNVMTASCGGANHPEVIYHFYNPFNSRLVFSTNHPETMVPTVVSVRRDCASAASELAMPAGCNSGGGVPGQRGRVTVDRAAVGDYWVIVDTSQAMGGEFKLSVESRRLDPGCSNGRDDDEDADIDGDDVGCESAMDEDERNPPPGTPAAACGNSDDDDGDGHTDYPYDPGCFALGDLDEADGDMPPSCSNGLDDDNDMRIDFPYDGGCQSRGDDNERNPVPPPECTNALDDDMDGRADYPQDPGCQAAGDPSEADPDVAPACLNGIDDDRDGISDFPFDVGCQSAAWPDETDPAPGAFPACSNDLDDDEDGQPDFPRDYGCTFAADPSEVGAAFAPQCGNRRDDDGDVRIDFPDDPGCRFAADIDELNVGELPPRCNDGVDNDLDDRTDFQDLGCLDAEDDDEVDAPGVIPVCGNEADDDADGLNDWPADPGCQARGDLTEDQGCRPEIDTPLIAANGTVMGATVVDGPDNFFNRCGGRRAPEAVYRYDLAQAVDSLTFSVDQPGTDYPAVISVRTDCEEPSTLVDCAGNFARPTPTVSVRDAQPGEYYVFVDGGGPERIVSSQGNIALPVDPRAFVAQNDIQPGCGWGDAGNDAFDCFGRISFAFNGAAADVDPTIGNRLVASGAYQMSFTSDKPHTNVWRMRFEPVVDFDERPVTITITGNLGSDGGEAGNPDIVVYEGHNLPWLHTQDPGPNDPPVTQLAVAADPQENNRVSFARQRDDVTITALNIKLPFTMYIAVSYANTQAVLNALLSDLELQAGPQGPDAPRFGNFELSVREN